jgi:hypothetical protein
MKSDRIAKQIYFYRPERRRKTGHTFQIGAQQYGSGMEGYLGEDIS